MRRTIFSTSQWLLLAGIILFGVRGMAAATADFDDLTLTPESYWRGPDPNGTNVPGDYGTTVRVGSFQSGNIEFVNRYNLDWSSWSGFAYSNTTDTITAGYLNQYSAYTGSGYGPGDDIYGVAFGNVENLDSSNVSELEQLPYVELPLGATIQSAYITNTTYAALAMRDGEGPAKKFGGASGDDEDEFKLTVYGTDALGNPLPNTKEFWLADYTSSDNSQDYIVDEWTLVDLSPLAGAKCLYFNLTSTDNGDYGMNTPAYFAIDNIEFAPMPGDADIDGNVDVVDLGILATNYGTSGTQWGDGDFNEDGTVDVDDLGILATAYNGGSASATSQAVPEPSALSMVLVLCGLSLWARKRPRS